MRLGTVIFFLFLAPVLIGQNLVVTHKATTYNPEVGQKFKITYRLQLESGQLQYNGRIGVLQPEFKGFEIVEQASKAPGIGFGFDFSMALHEYVAILKSDKEGEYVLDPVTFVIGKKEYKSQSVKITVGPKSSSQSSIPQENPNLFARIHLNKSSCYVGEPIVATYNIYFRYRNIDVNYNPVTAENFWSEVIDSPKGGWPTKNEQIEGVTYGVFPIHKQLLFPKKSGELEVPSFTAVVNAKSHPFARPEKITVTSNTRTVNIKALPDPPAGFSGLVGSFDMDAEISKTDLSADEGLDISVTVSGKGNFAELSGLNFEFPLDFETYDPEVKQKFSTTTGGLSGEKTFNYLGIPRAGGEYTVGPIELVYFDPKSRSYKTLSAGAWDVKVEKSGTGSGTSFNSANQRDVELLSKGIRHIREEAELLKKEDLIFGTTTFWTLYTGPFVLFLAFVFIRKRKQSRPDDEKAKRKKGAARIAISSLKEAKKGLDNNDPGKFTEAMLLGLFGYLRNRMDLDIAHTNTSSIRTTFEERQVPNELTEKFISIIERCEMARYAPMTESASESIYQEGIEVIGKLEHELHG